MPGISPTLAVLVVHVVLAALVFSVFSVEVFEFPKMLLLRATCVALAVAGVWAWLGGAPRRDGARAPLWRDPLALAGFAFLVSAAASAVLGVSPSRSFLGSEHRFHGVLTFAGYGLLFVAARTLVVRLRAEPALLWAAATGAAGVVAYGAVQALGLDPLLWGDVHRFRDQLRPGSTLGNPNFSGAHLAMTLPVVVVLARRAFGAGHAVAGAGLVALGAASVALVAATLTRGSWLALAVALPALAALLLAAGDRRGARAVVVGGALAALISGALLATPPVRRVATHAAERLGALEVPGQTPRAEFWRAAWEAFRERPWLGTGPDTFQLVYPAHQSPASWRLPMDGAPSHAHHEALQVAVTQGVVGLLALAAALALLARAGWRALRDAPERRVRVLVAGACALWIAYAVTGQVGFTVVATGSLAATTAGLLAGVAARGAAPPVRAATPGGLALALAGAGVAGAGLLLANALALLPPTEPAAWVAAAAVLAATLATAAAAFATEPADLPAPAARRARAGPGATFLAGGVAALLASAALGALVVAPYRADAFARRGRALLGSGQPGPALAFLEEAARRSPGRELVQLELGVAHHRLALAPGLPPETRVAHLEAALRAAERAIALEPADPLGHANRARVLADLWHLRPDAFPYAEVAAGFEAALARAPRHPRVLADAARAALAAGQTDAALALARRSLDSYPRHAAAWVVVAAARMERGELLEAETALRAALAADWRGEVRQEGVAWRNLARVLDELGRPAEARAALAESARILGSEAPPR